MPDSDLQKIDTRQETTVPKGRVRLRILTTGDLHAHLTAFDYFTESERPTQGLTRVASLIRDARAQAPNTLLFDNGDLLQGGNARRCLRAGMGGWLAERLCSSRHGGVQRAQDGCGHARQS